MALKQCRELSEIVLANLDEKNRWDVRQSYIELLGNAIKASEMYGGKYVVITWILEGNNLQCEVVNSGIEFVPQPEQQAIVIPDNLEEYVDHGRGLPLALWYSDGLQFIAEHNETHAIAYWDLRRGGRRRRD